jgi:hypothetical protein
VEAVHGRGREGSDHDIVGSSEVKALEKRTRELERVLDKKTLANAILREAVKVAHEIADLALAVIARRGFAVKTVADLLWENNT